MIDANLRRTQNRTACFLQQCVTAPLLYSYCNRFRYSVNLYLICIALMVFCSKTSKTLNMPLSIVTKIYFAGTVFYFSLLISQIHRLLSYLAQLQLSSVLFCSRSLRIGETIIHSHITVQPRKTKSNGSCSLLLLYYCRKII